MALALAPRASGLVPGLRWGPAVLLEQRGGVPDAVDRHHVVHRDELAVEGARFLHVRVERVRDLGALVVVGVEDVVERLELLLDGVEPDGVLTRVVDQVGRGAADEARLQLLGDLRRRRHLDRDARKVLLLLDLVGGELDVVVAVAAVENHGLHARGLREPERVGGRLRGATTAARGRPAARGERSSERHERRCRKGATEQGPAVELWDFSAHRGIPFVMISSTECSVVRLSRCGLPIVQVRPAMRSPYRALRASLCASPPGMLAEM